jgi:o-succinylbenzoate synthase
VKIWVHRYELTPGPDRARAAAAARSGALLKVDFADDATGYADLHPWTEFGQAPLEDQLVSLGSGQPTPLAQLALRHARTDGAARRGGRSLFTGLPGIRSHGLFTDWADAPAAVFEECLAAGYSAAKLKVGRAPEREADALNALAGLPLRWRLDANASFTPETLSRWLARLVADVRRRIEFLEDPCAYDPAVWTALAADEKIPLALDWELPNSPASWRGAAAIVVKPASQDAFALGLAAAQAGLNIVVTHSMDHPLGRATALWTAMRLRQRHGELVCEGGLQGDGLYLHDAFGSETPATNPAVVPPVGTGFGFDHVLQALSWRAL